MLEQRWPDSPATRSGWSIALRRPRAKRARRREPAIGCQRGTCTTCQWELQGFFYIDFFDNPLNKSLLMVGYLPGLKICLGAILESCRFENLY